MIKLVHGGEFSVRYLIKRTANFSLRMSEGSGFFHIRSVEIIEKASNKELSSSLLKF